MQDLLLGIVSVGKILVIFALMLYLFFALVVVRQVQLMTETLEVNFEKEIMGIAVAHLLFTLVIISLALVML